MNITVTGELIARTPEKSGTAQNGKDWVSRKIIIKTDGEYPQELPIEFFGSKSVDLIKNVEQGKIYTVECNLRGSKYKDNWYASIGGWKIEEATVDSESGEKKEALPF